MVSIDYFSIERGLYPSWNQFTSSKTIRCLYEALRDYLWKLERIDIERYKKETEQYYELMVMLDCTSNEDELNKLLRNEYQVLGIPLPYKGDFDDFMNDSSSVLEFK